MLPGRKMHGGRHHGIHAVRVKNARPTPPILRVAWTSCSCGLREAVDEGIGRERLGRPGPSLAATARACGSGCPKSAGARAEGALEVILLLLAFGGLLDGGAERLIGARAGGDADTGLQGGVVRRRRDGCVSRRSARQRGHLRSPC
jgi:hypothetical protein